MARTPSQQALDIVVGEGPPGEKYAKLLKFIEDGGYENHATICSYLSPLWKNAIADGEIIDTRVMTSHERDLPGTLAWEALRIVKHGAKCTDLGRETGG